MQSKSDSTKAEGSSTKLVSLAILVVGFSLATWFFFHMEAMPLTAPETTVVVGVWFLLVLLGKLAVERLRKTKSVRK